MFGSYLGECPGALFQESNFTVEWPRGIVRDACPDIHAGLQVSACSSYHHRRRRRHEVYFRQKFIVILHCNL